MSGERGALLELGRALLLLAADRAAVDFVAHGAHRPSRSEHGVAVRHPQDAQLVLVHIDVLVLVGARLPVRLGHGRLGARGPPRLGALKERAADGVARRDPEHLGAVALHVVWRVRWGGAIGRTSAVAVAAVKVITRNNAMAGQVGEPAAALPLLRGQRGSDLHPHLRQRRPTHDWDQLL